ncbi:hypothetical protein AB0J72_32785 [Dactylosporangium sp. NPDC049742]|uniref:hypothetical protein n=1 Tax=Dactylosporangium sp. NPDC049742 TaxID=3154737 RepID=UPI003433CAFF
MMGNCLHYLAKQRAAQLAAQYTLHSQRLAAGAYTEGIPDVEAVVTALRIAERAARV